jgi:DNA polymerase-3 subunit beta
MIKRTAFAADKREHTRFAVTGIQWEIAPNGVKLVATDTKRLAIAEFAEDNGIADPIAALVPLKAIGLLEKNLADDGEKVSIHLTKQEALFTTERATIYTRLVEGKFPPYQQFIPKKLPIKFAVPREAFMSAIRQAAITSDQESKRVDFEFSPGKVTMQAKGPESGASVVELELPDMDHEFDIAFDPQYLLGGLNAVDDASVNVEVTESKDRMILRVGSNWSYLLVPMVG